ncbi:hypothetical protein BDN70DRAFT_542122 [Pholiota conissans]|uniref:Uncharacterized protein n=1 Tax=Pholiota conissans TaxID=109636 RepID=A0A9P5Z4I6_9AGAR|nr:hypothetical protein BDN70DRAFT_542122 [Pholiota conissans]
MFLPRNTDVESCPSGHVSCTPTNIAVSGTDPSTTSETAGSPSYVSKPGMHRYIGIVMVVIIVLFGFALWVYFAKYPRRKLSALSERWGWSCCAQRLKAQSSPEKPTAGDISRSSSTSSSSSHCSRGGDKEGGEAVARNNEGESGKRRAEKEKLREKERNLMLQAEPRGVIKEVSGGVVMYTEVPRPALLPRRDRHHGPRAEWDFEHIHGVRFEARSPHPRSKPSSPRS